MAKVRNQSGPPDVGVAAYSRLKESGRQGGQIRIGRGRGRGREDQERARAEVGWWMAGGGSGWRLTLLVGLGGVLDRRDGGVLGAAGAAGTGVAGAGAVGAGGGAGAGGVLVLVLVRELVLLEQKLVWKPRELVLLMTVLVECWCRGAAGRVGDVRGRICRLHTVVVDATTTAEARLEERLVQRTTTASIWIPSTPASTDTRPAGRRHDEEVWKEKTRLFSF
ncbi:hypothetical protein GALMADRAFT_208080 [Galerina marginata CBS 339.88]|uniref:Uncharacterized protein n=1 Tax=Galerina marginata (strain CBS 339.88) TaxID=685588 RepID=A0A067TDS3_GALM3|nr:hypothetical protein GALMADRAFT_208080 [Galerina marginata CBS 339.88]